VIRKLDNVKILVVGAGAIGGYYGGKLAQSGAEVSAVCRSDYETVADSGIHIQSVEGDFVFNPAKVLHRAEEFEGVVDYVLVATKVLPTIDVPVLIRDVVGPETAIFLLQNGIGIEASVQQAFPENEVISGLAFICAARLGPGRIDHSDYGRLALGLYPSGKSKKVDLLASLFDQVGVRSVVSENIGKARWRKLVWNAPFNPISVLGGGATTREILGLPSATALVQHVMEEVCLLARGEGYDLSDDVIQKNIEDTRTMNPYKTSMLLDYEAKRPMEVEAILGNALEIASRQKVHVPYLESLYGLLKLADIKD